MALGVGPTLPELGAMVQQAPPSPVGQAIGSAGQLAASVGNPITGLLLQVSEMLGINPFQLATSIVQNPDAVADGLDAAGAPPPGGAPDAGIGEALSGSQPIAYPTDSLAGAPAGDVQYNQLGQPTSTPPPQGMPPPAPGTGTDVGIVPTAQAAPPQGDSIGALLSGVTPPSTPVPPAIGGGGVPNPNAIQGTPMDEIIRAALAVARPQQSTLTLQDAVRRG